MIRLFSAALMLSMLSAAVSAQPADVSGTIVDETGGGVPGATVQLIGAGPRLTTTSGPEGAYRFTNVASGTYQVTASLPGFAQATQNDVVVASSSITVPVITLKVASIADTVVVSATKGETALVDAPATMSVLTSAQLTSTPAQNYGDLLRALPGVNVIQLSARDVNITSRQATSTLSNSQLVLLDGRSIYLDFFGIVLWDFIPTNFADIKQIEVIRGPASAIWGANALTGVVNILTKSPREAPGVNVTFNGGFFSRDAGSTVGRGVGTLFGTNVTFADAPNATWSYRLSAGYLDSDAYPRPTGQIPIIPDPRIAGATVGGAFYPADTTGPIGTAFENRGTRQPKFDARVDQELGNGGRMTYEAGVGGTQGIIYTGIGPFDIQSGSYMGFAKANYAKDALNVNFFTNFVSAEAPNLLLIDPATLKPLQLNFSTQTYDFEVRDAVAIDRHNVLSFGGNLRRNNFDMTIAPAAQDRNEAGAYAQDEILLDRFRFTIGGRVDKFGNLSDPVFSPRLAAIFKPLADHSVRVSFNRAFRSPSVVNNYLDTTIFVPTDLRGLAPFLPPPLRPAVANPFPLVVHAVGSELPVGATPQAKLTEESLTAYEVAYTASFNARTTAGVAFYVNDLNHSINFSQLPPSLDPYTAANPPPGWPLPAVILAGMAQQGIYLPRTAFTYLNLGPLRQKGLEISVDHRLNAAFSAFANYSWQAKPTILDDPNPYPAQELAFPPTNRFNIGFNYDGPRMLGSASLDYSDNAFWSDVLTSPYFGYSDSYTMVNGSIGAKWARQRVTTLVKVTNLFNEDIQQHVFGDILKRSVVFEVRIKS